MTNGSLRAWIPPSCRNTDVGVVEMPTRAGAVSWGDYLTLLEKRLTKLIAGCADVTEASREIARESRERLGHELVVGAASSPWQLAEQLLMSPDVQHLLRAEAGLSCEGFPVVPMPDEEAKDSLLRIDLHDWIVQLLPTTHDLL